MSEALAEAKAKLQRLYDIRQSRLEKTNKLTQQEMDVRDECEGSLSSFLRYAWKYIDPAPYIHGWHIDAICEHLEAVARGELRHLIINQPPRTMKSSTVSVALLPWIWAQSEIGPLCGPQTSMLYASYAQNLSLRDSLKSRRLIMSPWYQKLWGSRFSMTGDQNTKSRFENSKHGYRLATSVGGTLTGEGANLIAVDDAHNSVEAESALVRQGVLDWWDQSLSTRLNDPKTGAYLVIMQRLHENDLVGHIAENLGDDWTWLMLPMRYDSSRHCSTPIFDDPRTEDGELLWPERLGEKEVQALERALGPAGTAGQLQQIPVSKGSEIIKRDWWKLWEEKDFPPMEYIVASLDTAYTTKQENDYSALTVWGVYRDKQNMPRIMLMGAWQERFEINDLVKKTHKSCKNSRMTVDKLLIEDKAAGHSVAQELRRLFGSGEFAIQLVNPKNQDKVARAYSVQHLFAEGIVYAPDKSWADLVINQCAAFPKAKHDDLVDSAVMAIRWLRDSGWALRKEENDAIIANEFGPTGRDVPLYDV